MFASGFQRPPSYSPLLPPYWSAHTLKSGVTSCIGPTAASERGYNGLRGFPLALAKRFFHRSTEPAETETDPLEPATAPATAPEVPGRGYHSTFPAYLTFLNPVSIEQIPRSVAKNKSKGQAP